MEAFLVDPEVNAWLLGTVGNADCSDTASIHSSLSRGAGRGTFSAAAAADAAYAAGSAPDGGQPNGLGVYVSPSLLAQAHIQTVQMNYRPSSLPEAVAAVGAAAAQCPCPNTADGHPVGAGWVDVRLPTRSVRGFLLGTGVRVEEAAAEGEPTAAAAEGEPTAAAAAAAAASLSLAAAALALPPGGVSRWAAMVTAAPPAPQSPSACPAAEPAAAGRAAADSPGVMLCEFCRVPSAATATPVAADGSVPPLPTSSAAATAGIAGASAVPPAAMHDLTVRLYRWPAGGGAPQIRVVTFTGVPYGELPNPSCAHTIVTTGPAINAGQRRATTVAADGSNIGGNSTRCKSTSGGERSMNCSHSSGKTGVLESCAADASRAGWERKRRSSTEPGTRPQATQRPAALTPARLVALLTPPAPDDESALPPVVTTIRRMDAPRGQRGGRRSSAEGAPRSGPCTPSSPSMPPSSSRRKAVVRATVLAAEVTLTSAVDDWTTAPVGVAAALRRTLTTFGWAPGAVSPLLADAEATAAVTAALRRGLLVEVTGRGVGNGGMGAGGCAATTWSDLSDVTTSAGPGGGSRGGGCGSPGGGHRHRHRRDGGRGSAAWRQQQTLPPLPAAVVPIPAESASYMSSMSVQEALAAAVAAARPWVNPHPAGNTDGQGPWHPSTPSSAPSALTTAAAANVSPMPPTSPPPLPLPSSQARNGADGRRWV